MRKFLALLFALLLCTATKVYAEDTATVTVTVKDLPQKLQNRTVIVTLGNGPSDTESTVIVLDGLNNYTETVTVVPSEYYCAAAVQYDALGDYPLQEINQTTFLQAEGGNHYDLIYTLAGSSWYESVTGQQRHYTLLYRATVLDGAWVPEDALGSEFTSEGIEYALKNGEMQIAEDAEITLIDRYQELTIQYPEVCTAAVKLSSRQILSAGKNGLVLQVHDDNDNPAKLMVNKREVTTSSDGEITFNVGNDFSYDVVYEDGTHGTIRGTKLIQQIDEENNVLPLAVVLTEDQIKTMSLRGVTIALPSKGIERLFIPEKYVVCNAANGQCAVSLYPNHQYSYIPTSGENKRNSIQGDQLAAILGVAINPSTENTTLSRRIAAVERRIGIENAKNLGKVLLGMTSENMYTAADYDKAILSLGKKQIDLTNKISAMQEKRKEVAAVTKSLQICKTYRPVWMQYVELPMSQKSAFYSGHSTELQAYSSAAKNLEKEGIDQSVDLDKAIGFTEQLERKIEETKEQLRETNSEEKKAQQERKKVLDIQENHTIN